jgi:hypothetical protein
MKPLQPASVPAAFAFPKPLRGFDFAASLRVLQPIPAGLAAAYNGLTFFPVFINLCGPLGA